MCGPLSKLRLRCFVVWFDLEFSAKAIEAATQDFWIEVCWSLALDLGARPVKRHKEIRVLAIDS